MRYQSPKEVHYPNIVTVEVNLESTLIDGQPDRETVRKLLQKKDTNLKENHNKQQDAETTADSAVYSALTDSALLTDPEDESDLSDEPSKVLIATATYNFKDEILILHLSNLNFLWNLISFVGTYTFTGVKFGLRLDSTRQRFSQEIRLDISKINRHIFMKRFSMVVKYNIVDDTESKLYQSEYMFEVPVFQCETPFKFVPLKDYHPSRNITSLYNHKFTKYSQITLQELQLRHDILFYQKQNVDKRSAEKMKYAINIEDLSSQFEMINFTIPDVDLEYIGIEDEDGCEDFYFFPVKENELPPDFEEKTVCLIPMEIFCANQISFWEDCDFFMVEKYEDGMLFIKPFGTFALKGNYAARFAPNRTSFRACFSALDSIEFFGLDEFFENFEDEPILCSKDNGIEVENFEWFNNKVAANEEQMMAIKNVVNCTSYPFPYVVFGPPGTGKTSCIVECIAQILKAKPNSRILVTAQANSACDEVGIRLLKYISCNKVFRFYSASRLKRETNKVLKETSNLRTGKNIFPTIEEFTHFNVVIATLISCSRFVRSMGMNMKKHFDYIFVDECGSATELEALVPIVGLGAGVLKITTNVVLVGDHKQLGPVVKSDRAIQMGLGVSLMEHIMSKRRYQMDPVDKSYDNDHVTQLLDNFRSHPAILQFSNVLFYDSKLRAKVAEPERSFGTRWCRVDNRHFPILFHCVTSPSMIIKGGTSSYNIGEVKKVTFYVKQLLQFGIDGKEVEEKDIGIVTPYNAQLNKIREELKDLKDVEIGTAEYYQGREKKIIIMSTVKSRGHVGFLKSEKRLNVCLTRAKSLLIVVGNAHTLKQNWMWKMFIHFCKVNRGIRGNHFKLPILNADDQKILDKMNEYEVQLSQEEAKESLLRSLEEFIASFRLLQAKFE